MLPLQPSMLPWPAMHRQSTMLFANEINFGQHPYLSKL